MDLIAIINATGTGLAAVAAAASVYVAARVAKTQRLLNQRQLLLPLWNYMADLNEINPKQPITPEVLKVVNTLELVALCCEGGMVDPAVIKRTFRDGYMRHYQNVEACGSIPGLQKTGRDLLHENRSAQAFYNSLIREHLDRDKPKQLS